jgi:hypothetical protein
MSTSPEECIDALREAAERVGESPSRTQYEELGLSPSSTTISRVVGSWSEAKERADLEQLTGGERGGSSIQPKPDGVQIPEGTTWEELTPQQRWYYRNRTHRIECKEERRRQLQEWFRRYKREQLCCELCGEEAAPCLDLHHTGTKEIGVSQMVNHGYSRERIRSEIADCMVLCANCHRKGHARREAGIDLPPEADSPTDSTRPGRPQRARVTRYKRDSDGCRRCDEDDPSCLDFHHPDEKEASVGRMVANRRPIPEILAEIERCELLCANCHRREHYEAPQPADAG